MGVVLHWFSRTQAGKHCHGEGRVLADEQALELPGVQAVRETLKGCVLGAVLTFSGEGYVGAILTNLKLGLKSTPLSAQKFR